MVSPTYDMYIKEIFLNLEPKEDKKIIQRKSGKTLSLHSTGIS